MADNGKGMYDFEAMMEDFFKNGSDEALDTFQAGAIQSSMDSQLAQAMAHTNAGIAQDNMKMQANLERKNQSKLMEKEFNYGMESMEAQFKYENRFANKQHDRDVSMLKKTGQQERLTIGAQGEQDRLAINAQGQVDMGLQRLEGKQALQQIGAQGEQDRLGMQTQGRQDRKNIAAQGDQDVRQINTSGKQDRATLQAQGRVDAKLINKQGEVDLKKIAGQGNVDVTKITTQEEKQAERERANIETLQTQYIAEDGANAQKIFPPQKNNKISKLVSNKELERRLQGLPELLAEYRQNIGIILIVDEPYINGISPEEINRTTKHLKTIFSKANVQDLEYGAVFAGPLFNKPYAKGIKFGTFRVSFTYIATELDEAHVYKNICRSIYNVLQ